MRFTIAKADFAKALEPAVRVASQKSPMPILANVLITANGTQLTVAATDLCLSARSDATAKVEKPGKVSLPARAILERVKAMPDGPVRVSVDDKARASVSAVGAARRYTLQGIDGDEFPTLPQTEAMAQAISAYELARLLALTTFAVSLDETRIAVNSMLIEFGPEGVSCTGCDGHRISHATGKGTWDPTSILIPLKGILELRRLADSAEDEGEISFSVVGINTFFRSGDTTISVKLTDATFPPWEQVAPKSTEFTAKVPREALAEAVRSVALSAKSGGVAVDFGSDKIHVTSESAEHGEAADKVFAECTGERKIGVNARYVVEMLSALDSENVEIGFSGELDPLLIKSTDYVGVVMPMRI